MKIKEKAKKLMEFLTITPPPGGWKTSKKQGAGPPVDLKGQSCEVLLESGGKITLSIDADLFKLSTADYAFTLKLIEAVKGYKGEK